jgi:hypothetical protein
MVELKIILGEKYSLCRMIVSRRRRKFCRYYYPHMNWVIDTKFNHSVARNKIKISCFHIDFSSIILEVGSQFFRHFMSLHFLSRNILKKAVSCCNYGYGRCGCCCECCWRWWCGCGWVGGCMKLYLCIFIVVIFDSHPIQQCVGAYPNNKFLILMDHIWDVCSSLCLEVKPLEIFDNALGWEKSHAMNCIFSLCEAIDEERSLPTTNQLYGWSKNAIHGSLETQPPYQQAPKN